MLDSTRIVMVANVQFDQAGRTHIRRLRLAMGLKSDDEAVAWALGIAAGTLPTMTELKEKKRTRAAFNESLKDLPGYGDSFPRGFLDLELGQPSCD